MARTTSNADDLDLRENLRAGIMTLLRGWQTMSSNRAGRAPLRSWIVSPLLVGVKREPVPELVSVLVSVLVPVAVPKPVPEPALYWQQV